MKWLFLTILQLLGSVAMLGISLMSFYLFRTLWLGGNGMDSISPENFLSLDNKTLDTFFDVFASANYAYPFIKALALFMLNVFFLFSLFKCFFGPLEESDNPFRLAGRYFIYSTLIYVVKPFINLILNLATFPFIAFKEYMDNTQGIGQLVGKDISHSLGKAFSPDNLVGGILSETLDKSWGLIKATFDSALFHFSDMLLFILVIISFMVFVELFKYMIEIVLRYTLLGVLVTLSPLAIACGPFDKTTQIYNGWKKAFISQTFLIFLSNFFLKVFVNSWNHFIVKRFFTGIPILTAMMMFYAWLKIAQKADTYLQTMGSGALRQGNELAFAIMGASKFLNNPAAKTTNAIRDIQSGDFSGAINSLNGNANPPKGGFGGGANSGEEQRPHPLKLFARHGTGRNFARNIMDTPKSGSGAKGGSNIFDDMLGSDSVQSTMENVGETFNIPPNTFGISQDKLKGAVDGAYGLNMSKQSPHLDMATGQLVSSSVAPKNPLTGATISGSRINANRGSILGNYTMPDGTKGSFEMFKVDNPYAKGVLSTDSNLNTDNMIRYTDADGDNWLINKTEIPPIDGRIDTISTDDVFNQNEQDLSGGLSNKSSLKSEFGSYAINTNDLQQNIPNDFKNTKDGITSIGGLNTSGGITSIGDANTSGGITSIGDTNTSGGITSIGDANTSGDIHSLEGVNATNLDISNVTQGFDDFTMQANNGISSDKVEDIHQIKDNIKNSNYNDSGLAVGSSNDSYSISGGDSSKNIPNKLENGLIEDYSDNGIIAVIPTTGEYGIVEGVEKSEGGEFKSAPLSTASYLREIESDEVFPSGESRYSLSEDTGYVPTGNNLESNNGKSIIHSGDNGCTYTNSAEQSRANAPITNGCFMNDKNDGIFEVDANATLNPDGSYDSGSPIFDTEGNVHNAVDIQKNEDGGFAIFNNSNNGGFFAGEDGVVYETVDMTDDGSIQMYACGDGGTQEAIYQAKNPNDVQVKARTSEGENKWVTPQRLNDEGKVQQLAYFKFYVDSNK